MDYELSLQEALLVDWLKELKLFKGTFDEKKTKLIDFHNRIPETYRNGAGLNLAYLREERVDGSTGSSFYNPLANEIVLMGHLSVLTYLHELGHAIGLRDENKTQEWAVKLFARAYPKSFARLKRLDNSYVLVKAISKTNQ